MENKDYPELQQPEEETPAVAATQEENQEFVDYFADILPDQPVQEEPAPAEAPDASPAVTADTVLLSEIQSAVESILSEEAGARTEEAAVASPAAGEPEPDMVSQISSAVESILSEAPAAQPQEAEAADTAREADFRVPEEKASEETVEDASAEAAEDGSEETAQVPASGLTDVDEAPSVQDLFADTQGFDALENAKAQEPAVPSFQRPIRKGRPKRRKGEFLFGLPQIAVTCVWLAIILVTGLTLGRMLWVCAADVLAFGREDKMVTVTVYESDTMEDIIEKLHNADLIRYPGLFKLYADLAVDEGEIQPGIWDLNTMYD